MRRSVILFGVAVGTVAMLTATAASAIPDPWPAAGHRPTCDSMTIISGSPFNVQFNDNTPPVIKSVTITPKTVVGPGLAAKFVVKVHVTDLCSGVQELVGIVGFNGVINSEIPIAPTTPSFFDGTLTFTSAATTPSTTPGVFAITHMFAWDRYATITLDPTDHYLASTPRNIPADTGSVWAGKTPTMYIVDASNFVASTASKSVKKGASVKVNGTLTNWNGSAWVPTKANGIALQRQIGKGKWTTIANAPTDAAGHVVFTTKVAKSAKYQLVFSPDLAKGIDSKTTKPISVTAK
jgi:hypothetical protein